MLRRMDETLFAGGAIATGGAMVIGIVALEGTPGDVPVDAPGPEITVPGSFWNSSYETFWTGGIARGGFIVEESLEGVAGGTEVGEVGGTGAGVGNELGSGI